MLEFRNYIVFRASAILIAIILLFPVLFQFAHSISESHEHTACNDITTHIHEKKVECSICDYHFSTLGFNVSPFLSAIVSESFPPLKSYYVASEKSSNLFHAYLRGPPYLLKVLV